MDHCKDKNSEDGDEDMFWSNSTVTPTMNASDDHDFDYWSKVSPDQMLMRMRMPQIAHSSGSPCSCSWHSGATLVSTSMQHERCRNQIQHNPLWPEHWLPLATSTEFFWGLTQTYFFSSSYATKTEFFHQAHPSLRLIALRCYIHLIWHFRHA